MAERGARVIITTDHGTVRVANPLKVKGERSTNTNLRYKVGRNLGYDGGDVFAIRQPEEAGLPRPNVSSAYIFAREDDFLVYPNNYNHFPVLPGYVPTRWHLFGGGDHSLGGVGSHFITISMTENQSLHRIWASGPFDLQGLPAAAEQLIPALTEVLRPAEGGSIPAGVVALKARWAREKPPW